MKRLQYPRARFVRPALPALLLLAAAIFALAGPLACGRKATKATSTRRLSSQEKRDQNFLLPLAEQKRWIYNEVRPTPSKTPAYLLRSFNFPENSSELDREALGVLRDFSKIMVEKPKVRVLLLGMADGYGEKLNGENLGAMRAKSAREFMASQGVAKDRMEMATIGSTAASAKPDEKIAQSLDRRVEIWLMEE